MKKLMVKRVAVVIGVLLSISTLLIGCGGTSNNVIKVGSKDFTEQLILGQITLIALEDAGFQVEDKTNIAGSDKVRSALVNKDLDIYWEYTGTGWLMHLQNDEPITDPQEAYEQVKEADEANGLVWLDYAPLNNTYTILMRKEDSESLGITSISDMASYINENPKAIIFGGDHEFTARPDGLPALEEQYGFKFGEDELAVMDMGIVYKSLKEDQIRAGMGFATDGRIDAFDFVRLVDDKQFFPVYNASPCLRKETLDANPEIAEILNKIAKKLDDTTMSKLNYLVDIEEKEPKKVAEDWLKEEGFIK